MKYIDALLNRVPMYRLTLYYLVALWLVAMVCGAIGFVPYSPMHLALSGLFLVAICNFFNELFAWGFSTTTNHESASITALILTLIMPPAIDMSTLAVLAITGLIAMASKYVIAYKHKHLFNPAAFAAVVMGLAFNLSASWWVGTLALAPFVAVGGYFLVRQIARLDLVFTFLIVGLVGGVGYFFATGQGALLQLIEQVGINSPLLFLGFVMLTEPITLPPTRTLRVIYATIVAALFLPFVHIGSLYFTPELGLLIGNLFVFVVSPHERMALALVQKNRLTKTAYEFVFRPEEKIPHRAGQYMEWTLSNVAFDSKGNRRYLTIASSPQEYDYRIAVRIDEPASAFKQALANLQPGQYIYASQLAGDFTLPSHQTRKLAFIAGGIGITPFRSMIAHLADTHDTRSVSLLYAGRTPNDFAFWQFFEEARKKINLTTNYIVSQGDSSWQGNVGRIDADYIRRAVPDFKECVFYISGSGPMVAGVRNELRSLGVHSWRIKSDYFPGVV